MRSSKGITLISLISSVILILILAATTIVTSTNAYNQMKFEGAKAEIEEVQKIVDEIATDYQTYKNEPDDDVEKTYTTYFKDRYGVEKPEDMLLSKEMTFGSTTVTTGSNIFYFSTDNLNKYLWRRL